VTLNTPINAEVVSGGHLACATGGPTCPRVITWGMGCSADRSTCWRLLLESRSAWRWSGLLMERCPYTERGGWTPNTRMNATVRPVTALAKGASAAPVRPARYAQRWADQKVSPSALPEPRTSS
jgi:hypothetical protein